MAKITKAIIKHISKLIRIHIKDDELDLFANQLETALEPMEVLNELTIENVKITSHTVGEKNVFRVDKVRPSLSQDDALKNAKFKKDGFIVVKRVIK